MRTASVVRNTLETQVSVALTIDGSGVSRLKTGLPFFEHMLDQVARHGLIDLNVEAAGDLGVDAHHTVEDVGITIGQALQKAMGNKAGLRRYGHAYVPLDEALSRVVVDLSGRPGLFYRARFARDRVNDFDVDLIEEFLRGLVNHALITVHVDVIAGRNAHHVAETIFKAAGRALRMALEQDARAVTQIPSTKGSL